jgi:hypothetical protein
MSPLNHAKGKEESENRHAGILVPKQRTVPHGQKCEFACQRITRIVVSCDLDLRCLPGSGLLCNVGGGLCMWDGGSLELG